MTLPMLRRLHKWVALVVGVQILLWCVSGAMFAWLDHHAVQGTHLAQKPTAIPLPPGAPLADPRSIIADAVHEIRLLPVAGRWVYRVASPSGVRLHDARDGSPVSLDEATVRSLARAHYAGTGALVDVAFHDAATLETREHGAAWAARFDDDAGTTLWFSAGDGRLLETRTDTWRLFDLLWMLHTMDYEGRDDFNHPLVILFATSFLWVALTGMWLVVRVFRKPRPVSEVAR